MRTSIMFLATLLFASCGKKKKELPLVTAKDQATVQQLEVAGADTEVTMSLGESIELARTRLEGSLYGKFFYDRAEYYVVDQPTNRVMGSSIKQAILYYFDAELYRIQYKVNEDVVNRLINRAPHFSIKGLDARNRDLLKSEPPVFQLSDRSLMLNPRLDAFEITWTANQTMVKWKSLRSEGIFEYSEFDQRYLHKYRELEKFQFEQGRIR